MSVVSGRSAALSLGGTAVASLREWSAEITEQSNAGVSSNTGHMPVYTDGPVGWTVQASFYGYALPANPGTSYALVGYGSDRLEGTVLCTSVDFTIDIQTGAIIAGAAAFVGSGAYTLAAGAAVTDAAEPAHYSSLPCKANWQPIVAGVAGTAADLPDVLQMRIQIACGHDPVVTSNTGGYVTPVATTFEASATVTQKQAAWSAITAASTRIQPGAWGILKLYVSATAYYEMRYVKVARTGLPSVDRETGRTIGVESQFNFSGYTNIGGTMTQGALVKPAGGNFWP